MSGSVGEGRGRVRVGTLPTWRQPCTAIARGTLGAMGWDNNVDSDMETEMLHWAFDALAPNRVLIG